MHVNKSKLVTKLSYVSGLIRDPRYFQIIFLSSFLLFGILQLGWSPEIESYLTVIITCLIVQGLGIYYLKLPVHSLRSALITGLGLSLLFKGSDISYFVLAGILAIGSKFVIRYKGKHLFNPANFGLILPIMLINGAWISTGQWGSSLILLFFFGAAGLMILFKISRLETGLTFLLSYFILFYAKDVWYAGWEPQVVYHKLTNGAILLFAFFMITDPMTIPNNKSVRVVWAMFVALISFYLTTTFYVNAAPIWVLFFIAPFTPILDKYFPATKYEWLVMPKHSTLSTQ
jgi:Na+-transporting NADH:ubiquinone oxidoreductase subunit NqrB